MWHKVDARISRALAHVRLAFRAVLGEVQSDTDVQLTQAAGLAGEQLQENEVFQHYGFTSNPLPGAMAVVLPVGGRTAHGIIIATEHASYRLKGLASGEVALYTDEGDSIVLHRGRLIEVTTQTLRINAEQEVDINTQTLKISASQEVDITTPVVNASDQVKVVGQITGSGGLAVSGGSGAAVTVTGVMEVTQDVIAGGKSLVGHDHRDSVGGTTSAPL